MQSKEPNKSSSMKSGTELVRDDLALFQGKTRTLTQKPKNSKEKISPEVVIEVHRSASGRFLEGCACRSSNTAYAYFLTRSLGADEFSVRSYHVRTERGARSRGYFHRRELKHVFSNIFHEMLQQISAEFEFE